MHFLSTMAIHKIFTVFHYITLSFIKNDILKWKGWQKKQLVVNGRTRLQYCTFAMNSRMENVKHSGHYMKPSSHAPSGSKSGTMLDKNFTISFSSHSVLSLHHSPHTPFPAWKKNQWNRFLSFLNRFKFYMLLMLLMVLCAFLLPSHL